MVWPSPSGSVFDLGMVTTRPSPVNRTSSYRNATSSERRKAPAGGFGGVGRYRGGRRGKRGDFPSLTESFEAGPVGLVGLDRICSLGVADVFLGPRTGTARGGRK